MSELSKEEKIKWMEDWCFRQGLKLTLEGECGFGRECVGVLSENGDAYPDYYVYDEDYDRIDDNGEVWTPDDAYHKHECVAVLGRNDDSISQLYDWLKWFSDNDFVYKKVPRKCNNHIELMMGRNWSHRMVKQSTI